MGVQSLLLRTFENRAIRCKSSLRTTKIISVLVPQLIPTLTPLKLLTVEARWTWWEWHYLNHNAEFFVVLPSFLHRLKFFSSLLKLQFAVFLFGNGFFFFLWHKRRFHQCTQAFPCYLKRPNCLQDDWSRNLRNFPSYLEDLLPKSASTCIKKNQEKHFPLNLFLPCLELRGFGLNWC